MLGELQRAGLEAGRLGELVEGGVGAGQADRVASEGGQLGEEALVAVGGLTGAGGLGAGFALRGRGADGLGDGVGSDGRVLVCEQQRLPGVGAR